MALKSKTYIRRAEREDLDTVVAWMEDPLFLRNLYGDPTRSPKQIRDHIVSVLGRSTGQSAPSCLYLIIADPDKGPIGLLSLQNISWRNRTCSVDLYIGYKELRNGLTTAVTFFRAMEYCFDELNLHRISAFIYAFNSPSWRIFEKIGAKRELILREHVAREGVMYDMFVYGLLRSEFDTFRAAHADSVASLSDSMRTAQRAGETFVEGDSAGDGEP